MEPSHSIVTITLREIAKNKGAPEFNAGSFLLRIVGSAFAQTLQANSVGENGATDVQQAKFFLSNQETLCIQRAAVSPGQSENAIILPRELLHAHQTVEHWVSSPPYTLLLQINSQTVSNEDTVHGYTTQQQKAHRQFKMLKVQQDQKSLHNAQSQIGEEEEEAEEGAEEQEEQEESIDHDLHLSQNKYDCATTQIAQRGKNQQQGASPITTDHTKQNIPFFESQNRQEKTIFQECQEHSMRQGNASLNQNVSSILDDFDIQISSIMDNLNLRLLKASQKKSSQALLAECQAYAREVANKLAVLRQHQCANCVLKYTQNIVQDLQELTSVLQFEEESAKKTLRRGVSSAKSMQKLTQTVKKSAANNRVTHTKQKVQDRTSQYYYQKQQQQQQQQQQPQIMPSKERTKSTGSSADVRLVLQAQQNELDELVAQNQRLSIINTQSESELKNLRYYNFSWQNDIKVLASLANLRRTITKVAVTKLRTALKSSACVPVFDSFAQALLQLAETEHTKEDKSQQFRMFVTPSPKQQTEYQRAKQNNTAVKASCVRDFSVSFDRSNESPVRQKILFNNQNQAQIKEISTKELFIKRRESMLRRDDSASKSSVFLSNLTTAAPQNENLYVANNKTQAILKTDIATQNACVAAPTPLHQLLQERRQILQSALNLSID